MDIAAHIRAAGLRRTPARLAVLAVLRRAGCLLKHKEIADRLPEVDRVTLYRTLSSLRDADLVHRARGLDGAWRYGCNEDQEQRCPGDHIHFHCLQCHSMRCLPDRPLPWITVDDGSEVVGKQLIVYGRCSRCATESP